MGEIKKVNMSSVSYHHLGLLKVPDDFIKIKLVKLSCWPKTPRWVFLEVKGRCPRNLHTIFQSNFVT